MKYISLSKQYYKNRDTYEQLYQSRFCFETTVHIPVLINGNEAFFSYSEEVIAFMIHIYKMDKQLNAILHKLPDIARQQFIIKCLIDEIKATNDIEGVHSTRREIYALLTGDNFKYNNRQIHGLLHKYLLIVDDQRVSLESCQDIRNLYDDLLLQEIVRENPDNQPDGVFFRKGNVHKQAADLRIIHHGVSPEEQIISYMEEGLRLIHNEAVCPLAALSAFHYLFGYVHPFYDGNGRLNRFISSYLLSRELTYMTGFGLSNILYKRRDLYYHAFQMVNDRRNRGDITPFLIIFLDLIGQGMSEMITVLRDKQKQLQFYDKAIDTLGLDHNIAKMLFILIQNTLFGESGMFIDELADEMQMSVPSIRNYLKMLDEGLLLTSRDGRKNVYDINLNYFYH